MEMLFYSGLMCRSVKNMDVKDIAFPHLEIYLKNVPKSFEVFGISIAGDCFWNDGRGSTSSL